MTDAVCLLATPLNPPLLWHYTSRAVSPPSRPSHQNEDSSKLALIHSECTQSRPTCRHQSEILRLWILRYPSFHHFNLLEAFLEAFLEGFLEGCLDWSPQWMAVDVMILPGSSD